MEKVEELVYLNAKYQEISNDRKLRLLAVMQKWINEELTKLVISK